MAEKRQKYGNLGDMAEGILSSAIAARFVSKNRNINIKDIKNVIDKLSGSSTLKKCKLKSPNYQEPGSKFKIPDDTVVLVIRLPISSMDNLIDFEKNPKRLQIEKLFDSAIDYVNQGTISEWSRTIYENRQVNLIEIISDGITNSKNSKVDVLVKIDGDVANIKLSVKTSSTQFGQETGSKYQKQVRLWENMGGIDISNCENQYRKLISEGKIIEAVILSYSLACKNINRELNSNKTKFLNLLGTGIKQYATRNEDNVTLIRMSSSISTIYQFDTILEKLQALKLESILKFDNAGSKPILIIHDKESKSQLIQIRIKKDRNNINNVIEMGPLLESLMKE